MSRSLKEITADFDAATDGFGRQQAIAEALEASERVQRRGKRALIAMAVIAGLCGAFILVGFIFMRLPMPAFPMIPMATGVVTGFSCFVIAGVRTFQRERYAAAIIAFEGQAAQAHHGSASR